MSEIYLTDSDTKKFFGAALVVVCLVSYARNSRVSRTLQTALIIMISGKYILASWLHLVFPAFFFACSVLNIYITTSK